MNAILSFVFGFLVGIVGCKALFNLYQYFYPPKPSLTTLEIQTIFNNHISEHLDWINRER